MAGEELLSPLDDSVLFSRILLKMPLNELVRYRRISKQWKSRVDGAEFARGFKVLRRPSYPASAFLLPLEVSGEILEDGELQQVCRYYLALLDVTGKAYWVRPFDRLFDKECTQSVEGLIFYYPDHHHDVDDFDNNHHHHCKTALFNPTTLARKILPITRPREFPTFVPTDGTWFQYTEDLFKQFCATGFDPNTQEIVILITWVYCGEQVGVYEPGQVAGHQLFRSQTGEWKTLQDRAPIQAIWGSICVDGIIYFLTGQEEIKIVLFLIGSEHFVSLSLPNRVKNWDGERQIELKLMEFRGRVTLLDAKIAENGEGISIIMSSLEDRTGPTWTDRQTNLKLDDPCVFIGSGTAGELIIVPERQGIELHVLLCDVETGTYTRVNFFQGLPKYVQERYKTVSHAPIGYEFSTRFV